MTLGHVMTDWFDFRLQAITHLSVGSQVITSLEKTKTEM